MQPKALEAFRNSLRLSPEGSQVSPSVRDQVGHCTGLISSCCVVSFHVCINLWAVCSLSLSVTAWPFY